MGAGFAVVIIAALYKKQPYVAAACLAAFLLASTVAVVLQLIAEKRFHRPEQLVFLVGQPALGAAGVIWMAIGSNETPLVVTISGIGSVSVAIALVGFLRRVRAASPGAIVQTFSFGLALATIAVGVGALPFTPQVSPEAIAALAVIGAITAHVKPSRTLVALTGCAIMTFTSEWTLPLAADSSPLFVLLIFPPWMLFLAASDDSWARIGFKEVHFGKAKHRRTSRLLTAVGMAVGTLHLYLNPTSLVFGMTMTLTTVMAIRGFYYQGVVEDSQAGIGEMHSCVASIMSAGSQRQISHQGAIWANRFTPPGSVAAVIAKSIKTDRYTIVERQGFWDPTGSSSTPIKPSDMPEWYCSENGPRILDQIAKGNRGAVISEPLKTGATDMWLLVITPNGRQLDRSVVTAVKSVVTIMNQAYSRLPESVVTSLDGVTSDKIVALGISRMGPTRGTLEYISEASFESMIGRSASEHLDKTVRLLLHPDSFAEANNFIRSKGGDLGELVFMTGDGPKWFAVETYRPVAADEDLIMWQLVPVDRIFEPKQAAEYQPKWPLKTATKPEVAETSTASEPKTRRETDAEAETEAEATPIESTI